MEFLDPKKYYIVALGVEEDDDKRKVAIVLNSIGDLGMKLFNSFKIKEKDLTFELLLEKFEKHFTPKKNVVYERYKFLTCRQKQGQSNEQYVTELRNLASSCEYKEENEMIRDQFVLGVRDETLKEKLLRTDNLTLEEVINLYKLHETNRLQLQQVINNGDIELNKIHMSNNSRHHTSTRQKTSQTQTRRQPSSSQQQRQTQSFRQKQHNNKNKCGRCGQIHRNRCPALNVNCHRCGIIGHYSKYCKTKKLNNLEKHEELSDSSTDCSFILGSLTKVCMNTSSEVQCEWKVNLKINNETISCQLDTGAQMNVISIHEFKKLKVPGKKVEKCYIRILTYTGEPLKIVGKCKLMAEIETKKFEIEFVIVQHRTSAIIGLPDCVRCNLIKRVCNIKGDYDSLMNKHSNLFSGLGCLKISCHLTLRENYKPIVDPPRKIPFSLHERLKSELARMEDLGVISKVSGPTEWVSSMVIVEKPNKQLRICLDPRNLNKNLLRSHHPFPDLEYIKSKLTGARFFSTLDASSGFWMIPLDESSSKLCTFNTPFGRYKFLRLPYGLNVAPEIFHKIMTEIFEAVNCIIYIDDILVWGSTIEQHDKRLKKILEIAKQTGIKFNKEKCKFGVREVKYFGHIFNEKGVTPDPQRIRAIIEMSSPKSVKDLQRFLGMINYLAPFIKNLSEETTNLRELLKSNVQWTWNETQEICFNKLKNLISKPPVLAYYDNTKTIKLATDASNSAVGAVILQNGHPLAFASKTLTTTQQRYAPIEKELYAIVFGCEKFRQYLYGRRFLIETDHKPLVSVSKKRIADISPRLQRMFLYLQAYDFEITYVPGRLMKIPDTLSRAPLTETDKILDNEIQAQTGLVIGSLAVSETRLKQIENTTTTDNELSLVKKYSLEGWPEHARNLPEQIKPYWKIKNQIVVIDNLLFKGTSLIIPQSLRKTILENIHEGHAGIVKCKKRARGLVYWPKMSDEIVKLVESCLTCQKYKNNNQKEPLIPIEIPEYPWQTVSTDLFELNGKHYLIVVDNYSKYVELVELSNTTSETIVKNLKSIFSRHGIPENLKSDNGPPYNSLIFSRFCTEWDIVHVTSSPYYPKSNGLVERSIQTIKNILKKTMETGSDPYLALLNYRTTPLKCNFSPAELLMSRRLRSTIPVSKEMLNPTLVKKEDYMKSINKNIEKVKSKYDENAKVLPELNPGDHVYFKKNPDSYWEEGKIEKRRNRLHIRIKPNINTDINEYKANLESNKQCKNSNGKNESTSHDGQHYITRYGRISKPPERYVP